MLTLIRGLYFHSTFQLPGAGLENLDVLMEQGVISSDIDFMDTDLDLLQHAAQPRNASQFGHLTGNGLLFPSPSPFGSDISSQPRSTSVSDDDTSRTLEHMSSADMYKVISDLQTKKSLSHIRHYGSDFSM